MKKLLLGLLALSAVSMAAPVNLETAPAAGTNIFETGTTGAIAITGRVTSSVPVVKYVVYASDDNGATKLDTLALKPLILGYNGEKGTGFDGLNPKVYVKRVVGEVGGKTVENLGAADVVSFRLDHKDSPKRGNYVNNGTYYSTQMLLYAQLEEIVTSIADPTIKVVGDLINIGDKVFTGGSILRFNGTTNGEIVITSERLDTEATAEGNNKVLAGFAGGKEMIDKILSIKIN